MTEIDEYHISLKSFLIKLLHISLYSYKTFLCLITYFVKLIYLQKTTILILIIWMRTLQGSFSSESTWFMITQGFLQGHHSYPQNISKQNFVFFITFCSDLIWNFVWHMQHCSPGRCSHNTYKYEGYFTSIWQSDMLTDKTLNFCVLQLVNIWLCCVYAVLSLLYV